MTLAPAQQYAQIYVAERREGAWHVLDVRSGSTVAQFGAGAAGAEQAARAAAALNVSEPRRGPAAQLRAWRRAHKLTLKGLANSLGVSWITVQRWETGGQGIPPFLHLALESLERRVEL